MSVCAVCLRATSPNVMLFLTAKGIICEAISAYMCASALLSNATTHMEDFLCRADLPLRLLLLQIESLREPAPH